ncbi:MAG: exodeoxyribonuclease VII large subunit [Planctomycetaceae bacterium]|nr:exodeoxyribonuclease VII large subunit [Planctomycetaceae bacterium]
MPKNSPLFDYAAKQTEKTQEQTPNKTASPIILSISELTQKIKGTLENTFQNVWVCGQVSNITHHSSGHIYLTLKDNGAQIPATVWRTTAARTRFKLKTGMEVVCRGDLNVYPPQGKYQFNVSEINPKGIGELELAFRQLHEKLSAEGLFDAARKKSLPQTIRRVAVLTSETGAAVRDFLQVLGRRTQRIDVLLIPVPVQGDGAAAIIAEGIKAVNRLQKSCYFGDRRIDCLAVVRGGGSDEDLWAFNEEVLVRAVAVSEIPVVSGVGHEVDISLCDLAADVRALTPSEAAERIAKPDAELWNALAQVRRRFDNSLERVLHLGRERVRFFCNHPVFKKPMRLIEDRCRKIDTFEERLERQIDRKLQTTRQQLAKTAGELQALSPLNVLARGFSLTQTADGQLLRSAEKVQTGDLIFTVLLDGKVRSVVQN